MHVEKDYSVEELKDLHSGAHAELDEFKKKYRTPKRLSDHLIIGSFLTHNGVRLPKGLISLQHHSEFKQLMTALANKHYLAGRMYSVRKEHPHAFIARERQSFAKSVPRNRDSTMETPQPANSAVMVYCAKVVRELRDNLFEKCAIEYEDEDLKEAARKGYMMAVGRATTLLLNNLPVEDQRRLKELMDP